MELCNSPFLYVLRAGLWGVLPDSPIPCKLTETYWASLLNQARAHAVDALVSDGAGLLPVGQRPTFQQIASLAIAVDAIERGNQKVNAVLRSMAAFWEREGINAVLLKGQGLALLYNKPGHRTPGDIDWYLPGEKNFQRALALIKAKGIVPEIDGDGDYHYSVNGVVVEHHRRWCDISNPFKKRRVNCIEQEYGICKNSNYSTLAPLTNLIQLNVHILKHILVMGVGWRQLCDLALATKHYCGQYSFEEYKQEVKRLGLMRWTRLLYGVIAKYFGMNYALLPVAPIFGRDTEKLAELVMSRGNFGRESGKKMLGSYASVATWMVWYVPGEVLWRPIMLMWNRFTQSVIRKRV